MGGGVARFGRGNGVGDEGGMLTETGVVRHETVDDTWVRCGGTTCCQGGSLLNEGRWGHEGCGGGRGALEGVARRGEGLGEAGWGPHGD